jgi:recombination protein RecT
MKNAIAPWKNAIAEAKERFNTIALNAGNQIDYQSEAMFAMQSIENNEKLQKCHPDSIRNSVINVASIGLSLNPAKKQAYLVPRGGLAVLDISYIGLVRLATDSKGIKYVCADVVRLNDKFMFNGKDEKPEHSFDPFASDSDRGEIRGVYCYAKLQDGEYLTEVMSKKQIEDVRMASTAPNSPAWKNWYDEMSKKAVIKRAQKLWPQTDGRLQEAIQILNEHEGLKDVNETGHDITMPQRASKGNAIEGSCETVDPESGEVQEQEPAVQSISPGQQKVLTAKLKTLEVDESELLTEFSIDTLADLPADKINEALKWVEGSSSEN